MRFIVLFEDSVSTAPEIRKMHMSAHLDFLEANAASLIAAGPLSQPTGEPAGGLWFVQAGNEGEVERLIRQDPFWPTGLRKSFTILKWTQVYADGVRLIHPQ